MLTNPKALIKKLSFSQKENWNEQIEAVIAENFSTHPFSKITETCDLSNILGNYFAMSQAFPYLQAGSKKDLIWDHMKNNKDVPE